MVLDMTQGDASGRTYSGTWHLVSGVRACLRSSVRAHRQTFRGEEWMVLRDSLASDFFRVTVPAYAFLSRMETRRTLDEVWNELMESDPEGTLTQEEVVELLSQLQTSNLLQFDRGTAGASLFERYRKRRGREIKAALVAFWSVKIPLVDPDRMLDKALPLIRILFGPLGALAYAVLVLLGVKAVIDHSDRLFSQTAGVLAPGNLALLYVGLILAKLIHEVGHAAACKRYGGEVHRMGVMLILLAPLPYMDATSSWGFRSRAQRLMVGASGVVCELAVAAVAALIWAHTAPGLVNSLAYNVIFVASVTTLLFNLNPLMRFDGYHMLVDWLDVPNLYQRSREQLKYLGKRLVLRMAQAQPAARTRTEALLLPLYGVISIAYWLLLMATIIFYVAEQYLDLGVAMAGLMFFLALVLPLLKFGRFLLMDPGLYHQRARAVMTTAALCAITAGGLAWVPLPDHVRVQGVIQATQFRELHIDAAGEVVEILATPGQWVKAGEPLIRLQNPQLDFEIQSTLQQRQQLQAQELHAITGAIANLETLRKQRAVLEQKLAELTAQQRALEVMAPIEGIWNVSELELARGQWLARGAGLGILIDDRQWRFVAALPQFGTHLFEGGLLNADIRIKGQQSINLVAVKTEIMPFEQGQLPSPVLGMAGGGEIAVQSSDPKGLTAAEPFFRVQAQLPVPTLADQALRRLHGRLGTMRITLPSSPLLAQWERSARQFLQRKFRV